MSVVSQAAARRGLTLALLALGSASAPHQPARAETVVLKNGMQLQGALGKIASIAEDPQRPKASSSVVDNKLVMLVDDGLRRSFFSFYQVENWAPGVSVAQERIQIQKRVARGGRRVGSVGQILGVTPFDEWGNRTLTMTTQRGRTHVIQGITEVTPSFTKIEGLLVHSKYSFVWDMRVATTSIPRNTLSDILMRQIDVADADDRLRLVRFYIQAERYEDAQAELEGALKDFSELADLKNLVKQLRQRSATRLIREIELRRDAGQHELALRMLQGFPEEGVAGETLLRVREIVEEFGRRAKQGERTLQLLEDHLSAVENPEIRTQAAALRQEIAAELNIHTLDRMADYLRLAEDETLSPAQKLSLAFSGWLLGSGAGIENVAVSLSLYQARNAVRDFLRAERVGERDAVLQQLQGVEGVSAANVARLLAHMRPPIEAPPPLEGPPGLFQLNTPGLEGDPDIVYYVQLPPDYDPYRRYGCVMTLNGAGTSELHQIDWWAGSHSETAQAEMGQGRLGQATRRGYLVIAPRWRRPHQSEYTYSAREHAAVLYSLRDALRRFSIDTDRVFLSGHSMGGDAAWDIGLAHPDLWAGVLPISARSDKYVTRYWENASFVPLYFVCGDMDGDTMVRDGAQWDRYLTRSGFDVMIAAFRGRGHEHFSDEVQRLFQWMELHRREFFPQRFECVSMRPWDNFYWWVEVADFPDRTMVAPLNWPESKKREARTEARVLENNGLLVSSGGKRVAVWLAPELVDFEQTINATINRRRRRDAVQPSVAVMLEDVRTRGDRQHPFWAKIE